MYFNAKVLLIIVLYQCLTICNSKIGKPISQKKNITSNSDENGSSLSTTERAKDDYEEFLFFDDYDLSQEMSPAKKRRLIARRKLEAEIRKAKLPRKLRYLKKARVKAKKPAVLEYQGRQYGFEEFNVHDDIPKKKETGILPKEEKMNENDCSFFVPQEDYNMPIPYTANYTHPRIIRPDENGHLKFKQGEVFKFSCSERNFVYPINRAFTEIRVKCLNTTFLEYRGRVYHFNFFKCNEVPNPKLILTKEVCQKETNSIIDVGFKTKNKPLILYKICFDMQYKNTLYTWYTVQAPYHKRRQALYQRPDFIRTTFYTPIIVEEVYKRQLETLQVILNSKILAHGFIKIDDGAHALIRAHLMARTEFSYAFEQEATFFNENTAPQWQKFHNGIWLDIEKIFKRNLAKGNARHLIVTGTQGTCKLPDGYNVQRPLYLFLPRSVRVPMYLWKMDYNLDEDEGIVYLALNNPYTFPRNAPPICETTKCPGRSLFRIDSMTTVYCCTKTSFEKVYGTMDKIMFRSF